MKLSDYVMDRIAAEGVKHVFMLPGGGAMHLVDSLGRHPNLKYVCNLHEQGLAIAVDAYAQVSGFGVGLVTCGPGGTNAITGVAAAWCDSTPCLYISGQVKTSDLRKPNGPRQLGFQEIDIVSIVKPITKYAITVTDPKTIRYHLDKAFSSAKSDRPGPVWLDIPLDVQAAEIDPDNLFPTFEEVTKHLRYDCSEMFESLKTAKKPIILLGNGARSAFNKEDFYKIGIPILLTWKAADLLREYDYLFAGRPGTIGQRFANLAQQECDWLLCLGARLDQGQVAYNIDNFAPKAKKYIVDIDTSELQKSNLPNTEYIRQYAKNIIKSLIDFIDTKPICENWDLWFDQIRQWKRLYPIMKESYTYEDPINPYNLIDTLSTMFGDEHILVPGSSGACSELVHQALRVGYNLRILNSQGLGSMGFGVPAALGACIASDYKKTVCIEGDGGFQMNLQELAIISNLKLPIKFIILDNGGYGSIRNMQKNHFKENYVGCDIESGLSLPNTAALCLAYGIPVSYLESPKDIWEFCQRLLNQDGPAAMIVKIQKNHIVQPKCISEKLPNGEMTTCRMEHMWPFVEN